MINGFRIDDTEAHVNNALETWAHLPKAIIARPLHPALVHDSNPLAAFTTGWWVEGRVEPHALGPGSQPATLPIDAAHWGGK